MKDLGAIIVHVVIGCLVGWLIVLGYFALERHTARDTPRLIPRNVAALRFEQMTRATNGTYFYCLDCANTSPCEGGGTGAIAIRLNDVWDCQIPAR